MLIKLFIIITLIIINFIVVFYKQLAKQKNNNIFKAVPLIFAVMLVLCTSGAAFSHRVDITAHSKDGYIFTKSIYPDGRPVINGTVEIYDSQGERILEGKTSSNGQFSFVMTDASGYTIVVNAGMGHRNTLQIKPKIID